MRAGGDTCALRDASPKKAQETKGKGKQMFYTNGSSFGSFCGHKHNSLSGAKKCAARHADGCAMVGGYSDWRTYCNAIDEDMSLTELQNHVMGGRGRYYLPDEDAE